METDKITIVVGMKLRINHLDSIVEILEGPNRKGECLVLHGALRLWISETELRPLKKPIKEGIKKRRRIDVLKTPAVKNCRLDLHGFRTADAVIELEKMLDRSLLDGTTQLEIIHGIGGGALRNAVHRYLAACPQVVSYKLDPRNSGTTWAYI